MYENQNYYNPYAQNIAIVKEYFKKPQVLVIGILYIVGIVISLISTLSSGANLGALYESLFEFLESAYGISTTAQDEQIISMYSNSAYMSTSMLFSMIPSVITVGLCALSYFLIYFKSKNADPNSTPKAGVTILFVLSIISLVGMALVTLLLVLVALLLIIFGIIFMTDSSFSADGGAVAGVVFIVFSLIYLALGAVLLTFSISDVCYINSIRKSLTSVKLQYKGAGLYGVLSVIYSIFMLFSSITTMCIGPLLKLLIEQIPSQELAYLPVQAFESMGSMFIFSGLASLVSAVMMFLMGTLALGYKKHIKKYTYAFAGEQTEEAPMQSAPVYTQPQYPQPQYSQPQYSQPEYAQPVESTNETAAANGTCPQCGASSDENAFFCNNCGARLK